MVNKFVTPEFFTTEYIKIETFSFVTNKNTSLVL